MMDPYSKNSKATLSGLVSRWNPPGLLAEGAKKNMSIVYGLLPDIIDSDKVRAGSYPCFVPADKVGEWANGCWRCDKDKKDKDKRIVSYVDATTVSILITAIVNNVPIDYKESNQTVGCMDNMRNKIYYYVLQSDIEKVRALLERDKVQLHPFPEEQTQCRELFCSALQRLYENGTRESLAYGVFLLVMHAVFHRDMSTFVYLYTGIKFDAVVEQTRPKEPRSHFLPKNHTYFSDPFYSHVYYAYMFRDNYERLYETGRFEIRCGSGIPTADLQLEDTYDDCPFASKGDPIAHRYEGTPILSGRDSLLYIPMHDVNDQNAVGFMVFQYTSFSNKHNCYYRSGLFVSSDHRHQPEVRKIVITERALKEGEMPLVKGILKTTNRQVILSEAQMDRFCQDNEEKYPQIWAIKDALATYHKNWYCFPDQLVAAVADPALNELERLKLMLSIKSYCTGAGEPLTRIHCKDGDNIYKIMR